MKQVIRRGLKEIIVDGSCRSGRYKKQRSRSPVLFAHQHGNGNRRHPHRQHRQGSRRQSVASANRLERDEKNRSGFDL